MEADDLVRRVMFGKRVSVSADLIDYMGSLAGGVVLSQLMYLLLDKPAIWRTDKKLMEETKVTEKQLKRIKRQIKDKVPFIRIEVKGLPAKTWYSLTKASLELFSSVRPFRPN